MQRDAFRGFEEAGGDLGGVRRHRRGDPGGVDLDEPGRGEFGDAFAEDGRGDGPAEQAERGHGGAGGAVEVGEGFGDGVGEALVRVEGCAALRDVLREGGHGEGYPTGAAHEVDDDGGGRAGRDLPHERGGGVGRHRGHVQPGVEAARRTCWASPGSRCGVRNVTAIRQCSAMAGNAAIVSGFAHCRSSRRSSP